VIFRELRCSPQRAMSARRSGVTCWSSASAAIRDAGPRRARAIVSRHCLREAVRISNPLFPPTPPDAGNRCNEVASNLPRTSLLFLRFHQLSLLRHPRKSERRVRRHVPERVLIRFAFRTATASATRASFSARSK
jgi:hypothetical protein